MKRLICLCCLLLLALTPALAENSEASQDALIACLQSAYPSIAPAQLVAWGDVAAATLDAGGIKTLCVMEKQGEQWALVINNPSAFFQDIELPTLLLDSDDALFWQYPSKPTDRFVSFRDSKGEWGAVSQLHLAKVNETTNASTDVFWDKQNGTGMIYQTQTTEGMDENANPKTPHTISFPAPWLESCIMLGSFDMSRFPYYHGGDYEGFWPDRSFIQDAAMQLMPEYTFVGGSYAENRLQFVMDRPDGERVFAGYAANPEPTLTLSTPLPKDARYGCENFTTSLSIQDRCVTIAPYAQGSTWGVTMLQLSDDELVLGPNYIMSISTNDEYCFAEHPWSDVRTIDWATLPNTKQEARNAISTEGWAFVANPDPADRLHLRASPDKNAVSLGKYYNGTPVKLLETSGEWARVDIFGQTGWMATQYLAKASDELGAFRAMPEKYMIDGRGTLYAKPDRYSAQQAVTGSSHLQVIGVVGESWYHVWFPYTGQAGFMLQSMLSDGNG